VLLNKTSDRTFWNSPTWSVVLDVYVRSL